MLGLGGSPETLKYSRLPPLEQLCSVLVKLTRCDVTSGSTPKNPLARSIDGLSRPFSEYEGDPSDRIALRAFLRLQRQIEGFSPLGAPLNLDKEMLRAPIANVSYGSWR